jgi:hypothetical protein
MKVIFHVESSLQGSPYSAVINFPLFDAKTEEQRDEVCNILKRAL